MFDNDRNADRPTICDLVPGYAFYNGLGFGLAENLVNLVEWLLGWRK